MNFINKSIIWKLIIPIVLSFIYIIVGFTIYLPSMLKQNAIEEALDFVVQSGKQTEKLRKYYSSNIVQAISESNSQVVFASEHKGIPGVLPNPATFMHDISEEVSDHNISYAFSSPYPFKNRAGRPADSFSTEAWRFLNENPDQTYYKIFESDGRKLLRVGLADRLDAQACVDCHNSHVDSPKKDWQLGDVRAVLEMTIDVTSKDVASEKLLKLIQASLGGLLFVVLLVLLISFSSLIQKKVEMIIKLIERTISGDLSVKFEDHNDDELSKIMKAINRLIYQYKEASELVFYVSEKVQDSAIKLNTLDSISLLHISLKAKQVEQAKSRLSELSVSLTNKSSEGNIHQYIMDQAIKLTEANEVLSNLYRILQDFEQDFEQDINEMSEAAAQLELLSKEINNLVEKNYPYQ